MILAGRILVVAATLCLGARFLARAAWYHLWHPRKVLLASLVLLASAAHALCGDVNGDGVVNIGDALMVAQYDVGLRATLPHLDRCDVNQDGACNIGDALRIAQCDVGLGSCAFPASVTTGACPVTTTTTSTSTSTSTSRTTSTSTSTTSTSMSTSTTTTTLPVLTLTFQPQACDCTTLPHACAMLVFWDNGAVSIRLERSLDQTTWTTVLAASVLGQTSVRDAGLPDGTTVYYRYTILGTPQAGTFTLVPIGQQASDDMTSPLRIQRESARGG